MATIKVHGSMFSPYTTSVLACLHEKGLDYEFVQVNMMGAGEHKKPAFISLNPFGQVPVFGDGDLTLFESRAINRYITSAYADNGTLLVPKEPKEMAIVAVGLEVEAHKYGPPAGKLTKELCIKPLLGMVTDEGIVKEQEAELAKVLEVYELRLAESKYLSGDAFTLTDLHHLPTLDYLMGTQVKEVINAHPRVSAWCAQIMSRSSWQKVIDMKKKSH